MCMQVKQYMSLVETMRTHNNNVTISGEAIETDENMPFGIPFDKRPGHWSQSGKPAPKRCGYGCGFGCECRKQIPMQDLPAQEVSNKEISAKKARARGIAKRNRSNGRGVARLCKKSRTDSAKTTDR